MSPERAQEQSDLGDEAQELYEQWIIRRHAEMTRIGHVIAGAPRDEQEALRWQMTGPFIAWCKQHEVPKPPYSRSQVKPSRPQLRLVQPVPADYEGDNRPYWGE